MHILRNVVKIYWRIIMLNKFKTFVLSKSENKMAIWSIFPSAYNPHINNPWKLPKQFYFDYATR